MGVIGYNTIAGTDAYKDSSSSAAWDIAGEYTPAQDEVLVDGFVYAIAEAGRAETVEVGCYRVSDGVLIEKTTISIPQGAGTGWYSASFAGAATLQSGVAYRNAFTGGQNMGVNLFRNVVGSAEGYDLSITGATGLTSPFVQDGVGNYRYSSYLTTTAAASTPTITNIDTDNAVNQYQQAIVNVADFTETITSVTLGGTACTVPENDPTDDQITLGVPGSLTTGTYDLVISGATETDTLTGVSYTQTHARPAFDGLVDSNSILSGQSYTANTYFRFVTSFSNGTLDTAAGDSAEWAGDIADYYTPDAEYTGDDTASVQYLYSDGTTSATVVITVSVVDGIVVTVRLKKAMRNTMRKSMKQTMRAR